MFDRLRTETRAIVNSIIELVYFMRGAIGYEEMMRRTPGERQLINEFLSKRIENEKKNMHPVY